MTDLDAEQHEDVSESKDEAKLPKHLRLRYWNNWEEAKLIELWRRHSAEVVTLAKNIPVFRTISDSMRECGFYVNPQECRRKINSMKNKYIQERRRLEISDEYNESEWRLYPLVHCLLVPKQKNPNLMHQVKIVNEVLAQLSPMQKHISTTEAAQELQCEFPGPKTASKILNNGILCVPAPRRAYIPRPDRRNSRLPNNTISLQNTGYDTIAVPIPPPHQADNNSVSYLLQHTFTEERLEQLREDNNRLTDQRNDSIKRLKVDEKEFKVLEAFFQSWQQQLEAQLKHLRTAFTNVLVEDGVAENNAEPADRNTLADVVTARSSPNIDDSEVNDVAAINETTEI